MNELRASHTATLLPNGKVLIDGGFKKVHTYDQVYFKSAELYDPQTRTFTTAGNLNQARCGHSATLLSNGTVLIVGGGDDNPLSSAEIYDPHTNNFTLVGDMAKSRQGHTATLLKDGNVLIVGSSREDERSAEMFNSKTRRFEAAGTLNTNRISPEATLLADGKVLVTGGTTKKRGIWEVLASAELYDPQTKRFTQTGNMTTVRYKHGAILLPDSTVLIAGGSDERDWRGQYNTAEVYDMNRKTFTATRDMQAKRFKIANALTLLNNGSVFIAGGSNRAEIYDPHERIFTSVAQFEEPHFFATATLLSDGSVLIAGGYNTQPQSTDMAWVFKQ